MTTTDQDMIDKFLQNNEVTEVKPYASKNNPTGVYYVKEKYTKRKKRILNCLSHKSLLK